MDSTNRYHALLHRLLDDIHASDHLAQFVHWRRTKARSIDALTQEGQESKAWAAFRGDVEGGYEHGLLGYLRKGIDQRGLSRRKDALRHFRDVHERRVKNELRRHYDHPPLVGHGVTRTLDALILFYEQLETISRSSMPERFASRSGKALEKGNIDEFVRIARREQRFYGDIAIISHRLGLPGSVQDYAAAQERNGLRRKVERGMFVGLAGAAAFALGAMASVIALHPPSHADALDDAVVQYIQEDRIFDDEVELRLEQQYGFDIVGSYTPEDLAKLEERLETNYPPEIVRLFGLRRIAILPDELRTHVDYAGKAIRGTGEMRLFSGSITDVIDHEMAHFQTFTHERMQSGFIERWQRIAGPYGRHVEHDVGPRERGNVARNVRYIDGQESHLPRHGYIRAYGGVNYHEDIATFIEAVRSESLVFSLLTRDIGIYERKLSLLREYRYISEEEFAQMMDIIAITTREGPGRRALDADICLPDRPEAL